MQQAMVACLHPVNPSLLPPKTRFTWTHPSHSPTKTGLVRSSMRAGSTDGLDHLQRAPKPRQPQPQKGNPPRRLIQTTPFGVWDSFTGARTLEQMLDTMERVMDGTLAAPTAMPMPMRVPRMGEDAAGYHGGRTPWDVKESKGEYKVRFDMPGMTRRDVKVGVQERTLVVLAEKTVDEGGEVEGEAAWPAENFGRYRTRIVLPENVVVEKIRAEVKDGVLDITIPKASMEGKVLSIEVQ